jgi:hypothetical protein
MTSSFFKGFHSLQEVVCTGRSLKPEVKLLGLQLYRLPDEELLASLNVFSSNCVTLGDYSSCIVNPTDTHKSQLRILVADLSEGESRGYKCTANTVDSYGMSKILTWRIVVTRESGYSLSCYCGFRCRCRFLLVCVCVVFTCLFR